MDLHFEKETERGGRRALPGTGLLGAAKADSAESVSNSGVPGQVWLIL